MGSLKILCGNIVDDRFLMLGDAIVNPTTPMMRMGSGVSEAIFKKAGIDKLEQYTEQQFKISYSDSSRKNEMKPTEIRVTPGFRIPCDIIFAQSPNLYNYEEPDKEIAYGLLYQTYENVLQFAENKGYHTLLLPSLGTGHYGFRHEMVAPKVMEILKNYTAHHKLNVVLILFDEKTASLYKTWGNTQETIS